jgi:hypothetical protein
MDIRLRGNVVDNGAGCRDLLCDLSVTVPDTQVGTHVTIAAIATCVLSAQSGGVVGTLSRNCDC